MGGTPARGFEEQIDDQLSIIDPRMEGNFWYRYGDSNPGPVAENHVS